MRRMWMLILAVFVCPPCYAQSDEPGAYKKESFNYSEWAKGKFSEITSVTNARRMLYLAGAGSEDEKATGAAKILYPGDMYAQCKYAWDKIRRILEKQGGGLENIVSSTTYVTDMRSYISEGGFKCRAEVFGTIAQPAGTLVGVTSLAWPGMMIEVQVTAALPK